MSSPASAHPLDADLLDYVEGFCKPTTANAIAAHIAECLLCRIKRQRLTGTPPMDLVDVGATTFPPFGRIEVEREPGVKPRRGELWLTAADDAAMVLVTNVRAGGGGVVVMPVTLDIEVADHGSLVLEGAASPLSVPIVVYEDLRVSMPAVALVERVVPARYHIDLLALRDGDQGLSRGSAIEGPDDPRLEVRQFLLDRLAALDPYEPEPETDGQDRLDRESRLAVLRAELLFRRGPDCDIQQLSKLPLQPGEAIDWIGIAQVTDFTVRVIVIETPAGLRDAADFSAAQAVITRLNGSALVVCTRMTGMADVYDAPTLFRAFELPDGTRTSAPLIYGLEMADAVAKYLDQKRVSPSVSSASQQAPRVDASVVLTNELAHAIDAAARRAPRLGPEKGEGYRALKDWREQLVTVLVTALEPDFDPDLVLSIFEEKRP